MTRFLDDLAHDDLTRLVIAITALNDAGVPLYARGLNPRFDLTPGQPMRITVEARMPEWRHPLDGVIPRVSGWDLGRRDETVIRDEVTGDYIIVAPPAPAPEAAPEAEAETDPTPEPELTEAVTANPGEGAEDWLPCGPVDPLPGSAPVQDDAGEGEIILIEQDDAPLVEAAPHEPGASGVHTAQPAEDPAGGNAVPPGREPEAEKATPAPPWTEEEDARAVALVVEGVRQGLTKTKAMASAARLMGRPEAGFTFRCRKKLKDRLDAALSGAPSEPPADAPTQPAGASEGGGQSSPAPLAPDPVATWADLCPALYGTPLRDHLRGCSLQDWALSDDLALLDGLERGVPMGLIADQIGCEPHQITTRRDRLTGKVPGGPARYSLKQVVAELRGQLTTLKRLRAALRAAD